MTTPLTDTTNAMPPAGDEQTQSAMKLDSKLPGAATPSALRSPSLAAPSTATNDFKSAKTSCSDSTAAAAASEHDDVKLSRTETSGDDEEEEEAHYDDKANLGSHYNKDDNSYDEEDSHDDSYDSQGRCNCSTCREERAEADDFRDDDSNYDNDYDFEATTNCSCPACRQRDRRISFLRRCFPRYEHGRIHGHSDGENEDEADEEDEDGNADSNEGTPCAICFTSRNTLVQLPCCGGGATESSSTTRICSTCMYKCLNKCSVADSNATGECPRCRKLVSMTHSGTIEVTSASFPQMLRYAQDYQTVDFTDILSVLSYAEARYLPIQILLNGGDPDPLHRLVQWGMLTSVTDGKLYCIERQYQQELRRDIRNGHNDSCNCSACNLPMSMAYSQLRQAACTTLYKGDLVAAVRLYNRCVFLFLRSRGHLKPDLSLLEEIVVSLLNFILVVLGGAAFLLSCFLAQLVTWGLLAPKQFIIISMVIYGVFRCGMFILGN